MRTIWYSRHDGAARADVAMDRSVGCFVPASKLTAIATRACRKLGGHVVQVV